MKRNPVTLAIGALLLLTFLLLLFVFQVRQTELAVVTRFGQVSRTAGPGAHFKWPWPIHSVHKFDQRIQNFESRFEQVLTADGYNLLLKVYVGWNISDPTLFLTRFNGDVKKAENALEGLVRNAYSGIVGRHPFSHFIATDPAQLKLAEIEQEMQARLQADCRATTNGLDIKFMGISRLGLPESVTKLVFERMQSEREVLVSEIESEGNEQANAIRSRANSESAKLLAEADAEATRILGRAEKEAARSFEVFKQQPELALFLIKLRGLEQLLQNRTTIILDNNTPPLDLLKSPGASAPQPR